MSKSMPKSCGKYLKNCVQQGVKNVYRQWVIMHSFHSQSTHMAVGMSRWVQNFVVYPLRKHILHTPQSTVVFGSFNPLQTTFSPVSTPLITITTIYI